ncbi:MAG: hypothetical protein CUN55_18110 [Phototrophicales bacterium]|nr:MAG: hypothetical protein CUN55_18110 [Phototrophicales bacterium]
MKLKGLLTATAFTAAATAANAGVTCAFDLTQPIGPSTASTLMQLHFDQAQRIGANLGRIEAAAERINIVERAECAIGPGAMFTRSADPTVVVTTLREQNGQLRGGMYNNRGHELAYIHPELKGSDAPQMIPNPF